MKATNNHAAHAKGQKKRLRPGQPAYGAKLDTKLRNKFCKHVREGLSFETVCGLCQVSRATFYQWMQRGRAEPGTPYSEFVAAVERAEADAVRLLHIRVAASDPRWILERRHPTLYGPPKLKTETELSGAVEFKGELKHQVEFSCTDEEGFRDLFAIIDAHTRQVIEPGRNGSSGNGSAARA